MRLTLPIPIGVNGTYRVAGRRIFKSPRAVQRLEEVMWEMIKQKKGQHKPSGTTVYITFYYNDKRIRDIDGPIKPLLDCLQKADIIKNDSLIEFLQIQKQKADKQFCEVEIL